MSTNDPSALDVEIPIRAGGQGAEILVQPRSIDFGHGELFLGTDAKKLVWKRLFKWLVDHDSRVHHHD